MEVFRALGKPEPGHKEQCTVVRPVAAVGHFQSRRWSWLRFQAVETGRLSLEIRSPAQLSVQSQDLVGEGFLSFLSGLMTRGGPSMLQTLCLPLQGFVG